VVGANDDFKGEVPIALVVLNSTGAANVDKVLKTIKESVRSEIGAIASLAGVAVVDQLPKTRSGKVLRKNIRGLANGKPVPVPGTIDNPQAMDIVLDALKSLGYPKATQ